MKRFFSFTPLVLVLFMLACGSSDVFRGIRIGLAAAKTDLPPAVAKDVDDGIKAVEDGEACLAAATGDRAQKRIAQAKCGFQIAQDFRVILLRHNIGGSPTADKIAKYINTTILVLEEFYREVIPPENARGISAGVSDDKWKAAEQKLQTKLKEVERQLKELGN